MQRAQSNAAPSYTQDGAATFRARANYFFPCLPLRVHGERGPDGWTTIAMGSSWGTSIGPIITFPPAFTARSAAASALSTST